MPSRNRPSPWSRRQGAFTLIELLVVIAIVGLLIAMLAPALAKCRQAARKSRELTAGQQLMTAYHLYANDFRSAVLPGCATPEMTAAPGPGSLEVKDNLGQPIYGVIARRYPWRIAPYLDYNFSGLYDDPKILDRYRDRSDFQYVVSLSPSLGINADFVGGKGDPGLGFNPGILGQYGRFYITRLDEALNPQNLLVFTSARGVDPDGGTVAGFHLVDAPNFLTPRWAAGPFDSALPASSFGGVDPRHSQQSVTAFFDGHVDALKLDELRDMRKWANRATRADWILGQP